MKQYLRYIFPLLFIACNQGNKTTTKQPISKNVTQGNFDSIADLEANEKNDPPKFIQVNSSSKKTENGWTVKGSIICTTSMSSYRDIVLEIYYYDKSYKLLGKSQDTLKESIGPGGNRLFEFATTHFPNADSLKIIAIAVYNID